MLSAKTPVGFWDKRCRYSIIAQQNPLDGSWAVNS